MPIDFMVAPLTPLWLIYAVASSAALYVVKERRPSWMFVIASLFALVDFFVPFSYPSERILEVAPMQFCFALLRPAKMLMLAFGRGFLARQMSMKQHITLAVLPIVPLKGLPEHLQKRVPAFSASASVWMQLGFWLLALVTGATARCSLDPASTGSLVIALVHLGSFLAFMHVLLLGAALLATAVGCEPLVNPFNSFWRAESVADWWNYRWNAVIGTSLRCTVYDPIVEHFAAGNPGKPVPPSIKMLAGCSTFAYSALIHEQSLVNQRAFNAAGPLTLFFMLQPVLIVVQPALADLATAALALLTQPRVQKQDQDPSISESGDVEIKNGTDQHRNTKIRRSMGRVTTTALVGASILLFWCPVYEPPYSDIMFRLSAATIKALPGMVEFVPYCY